MAWPNSIVIPVVIMCAFGSAIFSGLTLGLLSLDLVQLKLLTNQPNKTTEEEKQATLAERILKIRKDGNYLLVTLLVGNVAVNSAFSILLGELTSRLVGFLISTVVITIFGEIIPQAICARYGLIIGGYFYPLLVILEWGLYPVVKPMAMLLNLALGKDLGTFYSKKQLKTLVDIHDEDAHILTRDEAQILKGGLNFSLLKASDVMTPIDKIYGLDIDGIFNFSMAASILKEGYSRIPVFDKSKSQCIVGLLFVKDLVLVDPSTEVPVRNVLAIFGRQIYAVDSDTRLLSLLSDFKKGETHLAVVRNIVTETESDPFYQHIGIITLEDILEEILQDEIRDEFDIRERLCHDASFTDRSEKDDYSTLMMGRIRLFDKRRHTEPLDPSEALAISLFLSSTQNVFSPPFVRAEILKQIILRLAVLTPPVGTTLYIRNKVTDFSFLILQGSVKIIAGNEEFQSVLGPWSLLGVGCFTLPTHVSTFLSTALPLPTKRVASLEETACLQSTFSSETITRQSEDFASAFSSKSVNLKPTPPLSSRSSQSTVPPLLSALPLPVLDASLPSFLIEESFASLDLPGQEGTYTSKYCKDVKETPILPASERTLLQTEPPPFGATASSTKPSVEIPGGGGGFSTRGGLKVLQRFDGFSHARGPTKDIEMTTLPPSPAFSPRSATLKPPLSPKRSFSSRHFPYFRKSRLSSPAAFPFEFLPNEIVTTLLTNEDISSLLPLQQLDALLMAWNAESHYLPDYTAITSSDCRILRISRMDYANTLKASFLFNYTQAKQSRQRETLSTHSSATSPPLPPTAAPPDTLEAIRIL